LHGAAYATSATTARGKHYQQEPGESNVKDVAQGCFHMSPLFKTPAAYFTRLSLSAPCRVSRSVDFSLHTRDLHGVKTRCIIKCGATVFDLVHGALLWLMMAPDNPAAAT
jgi:hypothetical protein